MELTFSAASFRSAATGKSIPPRSTARDKLRPFLVIHRKSIDDGVWEEE
jgi:hypothetical protein